MNKTYTVIRNGLALLVGAAVIYIFILILKNPVQPSFPLSKLASEKVDTFLKLMEKRPIIYPSQIKKITSYLKSLNSRAGEGFDSIVSFSNREPCMSYRYPSVPRCTGWTEKNYRPGEEVVWYTAPVYQKENTTFIFSGALGAPEGKAEVLLSETPILIFNTGADNHRKTWKNQNYELRFFPLRKINPQILSESGIFCLTIPESNIPTGKALKITVRAKEGKSQFSYFTLYPFSDSFKILSSE